ncbi:unannotated protein [freshwater metagenome]|uniref:Unannotated protein n=1 Tax=freshwater metagenome TaxID=449393 RepID=A0A6J7XPM4_9ZZZZ|nr:response regulator [Actinomycetota bacterium]
MSTPPTILVIDDHASVRAGIAAAVAHAGYIYIGEASSKAEAFAQIAHKNPQVIVVDLNLPDGSGLEVIAWARSISKDIGIVVLTLHESDSHLLAALQSGASAYVSKSAPLTELVAAIDHASKEPLSFVARGIADAMKRSENIYGLTSRELQVLSLLATGAATSVIATELLISQATVKTHLASIFRKLHVDNRTQAVTFAIKRSLI